VQPTQDTVEKLLSRCKLAIELHDVDALLECLGLPQHPPKHALIRALSELQENQSKAETARRHVLASSLLFSLISETNRAACADALIELQRRYYLQRMIDVLENDAEYASSSAASLV
jgi:hypothetical protein